MRQAYLLVFCFALTIFMFSFPVSAATIDVSVGTDAVIYGTGENVTVSGAVKYASTGRPVSGAVVVLSVTGESSTISDSTMTGSSGQYTFTPFTVSSTGTHSVEITATKSGSGSSTGKGSFDVETKKKYIITTDAYTYTLGDTVNATLSVKTESGDTPVSGAEVPVKIKHVNGSIMMAETTLTTGSSGTATLSYNTVNYGEYYIVAGNGFAVAKFEVPSFDVKVGILGEENKLKNVFSTDDKLKVRATTTITSSTGTTTAVKNADISVYLKDDEGNNLYTFNTTTESSDGVYVTELKSLSGMSNGKYYVRVDVTKSGSTQSKKAWFEVQSIMIDLVPVGEMEHVMSFLKGQDVRLGIFAVDMTTGEKIAEEAITGAMIVDCRDDEWKPCISKISGDLNMTEEGFMEFSKILKFSAPNETGEFFIEAQINTTSGNSRGRTYIAVQNIIAYAETKDSFDNWRKAYGSGETVILDLKALKGNWESATVTSVGIEEIRDDEWNDVTSTVMGNSPAVSSSDRINFTAPDEAGWYNVKLNVTTSGGNGKAGAGFEVRLYDVWVDTTDSSGNWQWRYGSGDIVYLHINVQDLGGSQVSTSDYSVNVDRIRDEMTGKEYTNLNVTKLSDDEMGRKVYKLDMGNLGISSGNYNIEFEITDTDGNKDRGGAWLKVSDYNVWSETKSTSGEWKWRFSPTDNVTFDVYAKYFNGSNVPDDSNISVENLMYFQRGPPMPIPSSNYLSSNITQTSSGTASAWVKAASGSPLPMGSYMVMLQLQIDENTTETQEAWFEVSSMDVYGWAQESSVSSGENVSAQITAKKMDGTRLNASMQVVEMRDAMTWSEVSGYDVGISPAENTSLSSVTTSYPIDTTGLSSGQYEAVVRVTSSELGASSDAYIWFTIEEYSISGEFDDQSKSVYAPGENVEFWATLKYPNGTAWQGQNLSVYQFARTDGTWSTETATMVTQPSATDSDGRTKLTFKAPSSSGVYRPMINFSGELQNDPWQLPSFEVRSVGVKVTLFDSNRQNAEHFAPSSKIQTEVNISNPSGGSVSITSISMKYVEVGNSANEVELQTVSSSITESNNINFTSPSSEGEYILWVTVIDNTTGNRIIKKRWFNVKSFDSWFHMDRWSYSPGGTVTVNFNAYNADGSDGYMTVELEELRNMWSGAHVSVSNDSVKNITGSGGFDLDAPSEMGEYEAKFCAYRTNSSCTSDSRRFYVGFSVSSFEVHTWPWGSGSYTTEDNVTLVVELMNSDGSMMPRSDYNVTFLEIRETKRWADVSSNITTPSEQNAEGGDFPPFNRWKILDFPAANLAPGEYSVRTFVNTSTQNRTVEMWFRISDYSMTLETETGNEKFFSGDVIQFNVTVVPSTDESGDLVIRDDYDWQTIVHEGNFTLVNGTDVVNVTNLPTGKYTAEAKLGDASAHKWFMVGGYEIYWMFGSSQSDDVCGQGENVSLHFRMVQPDGNAYDGDVNVTLVKVMNAWDWTPVSMDDSGRMWSLNTDGNGMANFQFRTTPLSRGEYEAEMIFNVSGKETTMHFWFMIKTKEFWAWPEFQGDSSGFEPGENVTIKAWLAEANGTPVDGTNVTIERVWSRDKWQEVTEYCNFGEMSGYDLTQNGMAVLNLTVPANVTGGLDIEIRENGTNEMTFTGFDINGYDLNLYSNSNKWTFLPGENITATLYVTKSGLPATDVNVKIKFKKEGMWDTPVAEYDLGDTGSDGKMNINLKVPTDISRYEMEAYVGDGAAKAYMGFDVASIFVNSWVRGESSGMEEVSTDENTVVTVYVERPDGTRVSNANVSILQVEKINHWGVDVGVSASVPYSLTDSTGKAELRFTAPTEQGEYIVIMNVTANISGNVSSMIKDSWFRVSPYSFTVQVNCPPGATSCDPYQRAAGENIEIQVSGSKDMKACVTKLRSMYDGKEIYYTNCNTTIGNMSATTVSFTAPTEQGEYDIVVEIFVNDSFVSDKWQWIHIGSASGVRVESYSEPHSAWPGKNVSLFIEMWDSMWNPVSVDSCTSAAVTKLMDSYEWTEVSWDSSKQWDIGESEDDMMGPGERYKLMFTVPEDLKVGDYEIKFNITCGGETSVGNGHFRLVAFQTASMMNEVQKANRTVEFWLKMTDKDGSPVQGATVFKKELVDDMGGWTVLQSYGSDDNFTTDSNGEVVGNFTTPSQAGQYVLRLEAVNGSVVQKIERFFRIKQLQLKTSFDKQKYFVNETVNITVNLTDFRGEPVSGATVEFKGYPMMIGGPGEDEGEGEDEEMSGPGMGETVMNQTTTNSNGIAYFNLTGLSPADYEAQIRAWTYEKGDADIHKSFGVKKLNITLQTSGADFLPGDTIDINVTVLNSTEDPLIVGVNVSMMYIQAKGGEDSEPPMLAENFSITGFDDGMASMQLTIPNMDNISGPCGIMVMAGTGADDSEMEGYMVLVHGSGNDVSLLNTDPASLTSLQPDQMVGIDISTNENAGLAVANFVQHIPKVGSAIPMQEMMGGGQDSGKEDYYESPIYTNSTGGVHMNIRARSTAGDYTAMVMFMEKNAEMFNMPLDALLIDYTVVE